MHWLWGYMVIRWGFLCTQLIIPGEATLLAEEQAGWALPLCDLSVMFLKALKMPLNTYKGGVPKEFRR